MSRLIKSNVCTQEQTRGKVISIRTMERENPTEELRAEFTSAEEDREKILREARREASELVSAAESDARRIKEQIHMEQQAWLQKKATLEQEAKDAGFLLGFEEGQKQGHEEYRSLIHTARDTVEAAKKDYQEHIEASERVILELGIKVAGKILGSKISEDNENFLSLVKRALKNARESKNIQLHINPEYFQLLLDHKDDLMAIFPKEIEFYIFPDEEISSDSCIIESENGRIDACVNSQLEEIKQKLVEMMESEQS